MADLKKAAKMFGGLTGKAAKTISGRQAQIDCQVAGGTWKNGKCTYPNAPKVGDTK